MHGILDGFVHSKSLGKKGCFQELRVEEFLSARHVFWSEGRYRYSLFLYIYIYMCPSGGALYRTMPPPQKTSILPKGGRKVSGGVADEAALWRASCIRGVRATVL